MTTFSRGFIGERKTSTMQLEIRKRHKTEMIPLLPGTRAIYKTSVSCLPCVGFRGYAGGLDASAVREDNDRASIAEDAIGTED